MADPHLHDRLFLLDGSSLAFRAFFALPESHRHPRRAAHQRALRAQPDAAQDRLRVPSRLHRRAPGTRARRPSATTSLEQYKAQRPTMPEGLSAAVAAAARAHGRVRHRQPGASPATRPTTSSVRWPRRPSARASRSIVVTGDRDAMQVVDDDIWVMSTGRGVTDVKIYTPAAVLERFGVTPAQIPDYIGLKGDSSRQHPRRARHRREDGGAAAAAVRLHRRSCTRASTRSRARSGARCCASTSRRRASRCGWRPWSWTCRSRTIWSTSSRAAATGCRSSPSTPSSRGSSSATCAGASRRCCRGGRRAGGGPRRRPPCPAASCVWRPSRTSARWRRCSRRARPRSPSSRAATAAHGFAVAAHAGGEVCLVAPGDADRCGLALAAGRRTSWSTTPRRSPAS